MTPWPWGPLDDEIADELARIPASFDTYSGVTYHPAAATTADGVEHPAVVFMRLSPDEGDWAEEQHARGRCIHPEAVYAVSPSPHRLPAVLADGLYERGAATQRSYLFSLRMSDGRSMEACCEQVVDFPAIPAPYGPEQVVDIIPLKEITAEECLPSLPFRWCFYIWPRLPGDPESE